ncbi:peptidase S49 [Herbaspirillum rubrisubalbicans]|jgi:protease-4|uniref:Peptidase S49 n=3 Tax=Herbaspirillum TaxID=963 RepID=A0ABX9C6F8_9BURK|nr:S49 family peptidase [Herbaspirillum rubrisubalbicans]MCP1571919.1 protease-4 [Herbaspirillum rubrisubalbicans]NQE48415.1 peptidase S49 [Herbaspirillum rubrisubalbicans]QJQ00587.1 S49 family peptidase [Herbaspirillum rubrisubalbicans Os34]RAM66189.1 peptidase S49 [Herbaspirillum rubrisubalbicans]RAN50375.1 peptidase S49 [Herbaspirillum rubrisubalbicans]
MSNNESENQQAQPPQSSASPASAPPPSSIPASVREDKKSGWERDVLEKLALFAVKEQRARRRWGIFFRIAILAVIVMGGWLAFTYNKIESEPLGPHTALVEIKGAIDSEGQGSAAVVIPALDKAFAASDSVGVILKINSPGGSPVQAGMINDEITRLRKQYPKKPIYVVVEEMCASGGYYIAVAADKIFVNKASLIGSVGVLMDGFGFTGLMDKLGVERRLLTAGENKSFLDPFSPQSPKQREYALSMLEEIHQQFIEVVRQGRGTRLKETPDTFSGLVWTGSKAVELGLADGFGTVDSVARDVIKAEDVVDYTQTENLSERVLKKFGVAFGAGFAKTMMSAPLSQLR